MIEGLFGDLVKFGYFLRPINLSIYGSNVEIIKLIAFHMYTWSTSLQDLDRIDSIKIQQQQKHAC